MRVKIKIVVVCFLTLFLLQTSTCKKDWGSTRPDIYAPLEGPPEDDYFSPHFFDIDINLQPASMQIGTDVELTVQVSRNDHRGIDFDIYYDWTINYGVTYYLQGYYFALDAFLQPRINDSTHVADYGLSRITVSTSRDAAEASFPSEEIRIAVVNEIGFLYIDIQIGYCDENSQIQYFITRQVGVPINY
ncbi:hypothetical protein ACFL4T_04410 [candidate division KSB1 bacterium]